MAVAILRDTGRRARVNLRAGDGLMGGPAWRTPPPDPSTFAKESAWLAAYQRSREVAAYQARRKPAPWGSARDGLMGLIFAVTLAVAIAQPGPAMALSLFFCALGQRGYWKNRLRSVSADRDARELLGLD